MLGKIYISDNERKNKYLHRTIKCTTRHIHDDYIIIRYIIDKRNTFHLVFVSLKLFIISRKVISNTIFITSIFHCQC